MGGGEGAASGLTAGSGKGVWSGLNGCGGGCVAWLQFDPAVWGDMEAGKGSGISTAPPLQNFLICGESYGSDAMSLWATSGP